MEQYQIKITVNRLKDYLDEAGIKVVGLARLSCLNPQHLSKALCATPEGKNAVPTTLSQHHLELLEEGLHQLSDALRNTFIIYNVEQEVVKAGGRRYCPGCVEQIKEKLSPYVMVQPFVCAALGWNRSKYQNVMAIKKGIAYGNISREDCERINVRLAEVSARLHLFSFI